MIVRLSNTPEIPLGFHAMISARQTQIPVTPALWKQYISEKTYYQTHAPNYQTLHKSTNSVGTKFPP